MSRLIPAGDYVEHCDPELPHHRAWLLAVLEQLVAHDPQALEECGTLRRLWTARQEAGSAAPQTSAVVLLINTASCGNPLSVPWFVQLDSATDQARRMCFSFSYAILLAFLKPGVLTGSNGDDQYLARVRQFGDTTSMEAGPGRELRAAGELWGPPARALREEVGAEVQQRSQRPTGQRGCRLVPIRGTQCWQWLWQLCSSVFVSPTQVVAGDNLGAIRSTHRPT